MNSWKVLRVPDLRPSSRSQAFGGDETLTKTMCLPPMHDLAVGVARGDREGRAEPVAPSPSRSRGPCARSSPSTEAAALRRISTASGLRNSMPSLFQDPHRPVVDGQHALLAQRLGRTVGVDGLRPRQLRDRRALAAKISRTTTRTAPRAPRLGAFLCCCVVSFHGTDPVRSGPQGHTSDGGHYGPAADRAARQKAAKRGK